MTIKNLEVYGIIYKITNKVNGKVYIGQTIQENGFDDRYGGNLEKNTKNQHLKSSIQKYGIDNFDICEVLEIIKIWDIAHNQKELDEKETYWIKYYDSTNPDNGYNIEGGGKNEGAGVRRKRVVCLNNNKIFNSINEASEYAKVSKEAIRKCCKCISYRAGINEKGEYLKWMFYNEYICCNEEEIQKRMSLTKPLFTKTEEDKRVICITTGKIYSKCSIADKDINNTGKLRKYMDNGGLNNIKKNGSRSYCGKLEDGTKMYWSYVKDLPNVNDYVLFDLLPNK